MKLILTLLLLTFSLFANIQSTAYQVVHFYSAQVVHFSVVRDTYGTLLRHTGSSDAPFLFTGEQYDPEAGLYYLRVRYYSPELSRFLSRDTYEGTLTDPITQNPYAYANDNPLRYVDPSGHMSMLELNAGMSAMSTLATSGIISLGVTSGILFQLRANKVVYISPKYEDQSARPGITPPIHHFYILASNIRSTGSYRYDFDVERRLAPAALRGEKVLGFIQKSYTNEYSKNFVRLSSMQFTFWEWVNYDRYPHDASDPTKRLKTYSRNWINCLSWTISAYMSAITIMLTAPSL